MGLMVVFFGLFGLFFLVIVVSIVVGGLRRRQAMIENGLDPRLTPLEQMAATQRAGAAQRPVEERLAELDDLLRREKITAEEHKAARLHLLSGP